MLKEPSAYALLSSSEDPVITPEQILFIHVLAQALIDASLDNIEIKSEVAEWGESEDFDIVCGMAGINPDYVKRQLDRILACDTFKEGFAIAMQFRFLVRTYIESHRAGVDKERKPLQD
jgi:hypothetical protein